jgi:hypothetical protein
MALMHCELIEWRICRPAPKGSEGLQFHSEGAQATFSLSRARKILKQLGEPWEIRHAQSFEQPEKEQ